VCFVYFVVPTAVFKLKNCTEWVLRRWTTLAFVWLFGAVVGFAAEPASLSTGHAWTFESTTDGWQPRAPSVVVSQLVGTGATPDSRACLRVQGRIAEGWNYALSRHVPLTGGGLYRLSAWMRVDNLGASTPPPFLKCEFVGPNVNQYLGQVATSSYDVSKPRTWQRLEAEFQAPDATRQCWLALEKGADSPMEIDAVLDEIKLAPIPMLSALEKFRLRPLPASLEKVRGVHPRLYLDAGVVAQLREAIGNTHAPLWNELRDQADRLTRRGPPAYRQSDGSSGDEQLWQRDVGNAMPVLAMAWLLSQDQRYLDAARQWALASCGYQTWGLARIDGMDLATGHQLLGLALVYDWSLSTCSSSCIWRTRCWM
jgi:Carbohydrate binding domain